MQSKQIREKERPKGLIWKTIKRCERKNKYDHGEIYKLANKKAKPRLNTKSRANKQGKQGD